MQNSLNYPKENYSKEFNNKFDQYKIIFEKISKIISDYHDSLLMSDKSVVINPYATKYIMGYKTIHVSNAVLATRLQKIRAISACVSINDIDIWLANKEGIQSYYWTFFHRYFNEEKPNVYIDLVILFYLYAIEYFALKIQYEYGEDSDIYKFFVRYKSDKELNNKNDNAYTKYSYIEHVMMPYIKSKIIVELQEFSEKDIDNILSFS